MLARFFWSLILISTLFILGVFFLPKQADEIAEVLGISQINPLIREVPNFLINHIGEVTTLQIDQGSGILRQAQDVADKTKDGIDTTKKIISEKANQVQKVADSVGKTTSAISELQESVSNLTTISTGSDSGAVNTSLSGSESNVSWTGSKIENISH